MNLFRTPLVILLLIDIPFLLVAFGLTSWLLSVYSRNLNEIKSFQNDPSVSYSPASLSNYPTSTTTTSYTPISGHYPSVSLSSSYSYHLTTTSAVGYLSDVNDGSVYTTFTDTYTETQIASIAIFSITTQSIPFTTSVPLTARAAPSVTSKPRPSITTVPTAAPKTPAEYQQSSQSPLTHQLSRRDSSLDFEIPRYNTFLAFTSLILVALIVRVANNIVSIILLAKNKHDGARLQFLAKIFIAVDAISTLILLVFALALTIYLRVLFGTPYGTYIAFDFFWMFCSATGILEVVLASIFLKQVSGMQDEEDGVISDDQDPNGGHEGRHSNEKSLPHSGQPGRAGVFLPSLQRHAASPQSSQVVAETSQRDAPLSSSHTGAQNTVVPNATVPNQSTSQQDSARTEKPMQQNNSPTRKPVLLPLLQRQQVAAPPSGHAQEQTRKANQRDLPAVPTQSGSHSTNLSSATAVPRSRKVPESTNSTLKTANKPHEAAIEQEESDISSSPPQLYQAIPDGNGGFVMKPYKGTQ